MFMGGLNPGHRTVMSAQQKEEIREHWQHVQNLTGRDFNFDFFLRDQFVYDTEPASRAVIACFRMHDVQSLDFMTYLQQAFYAENQDISDPALLVSLAQEFGLERDTFATLLDDAETAEITRLCFQYTRHLKINGFPTLIGQANGRHTIITRGYQPFEKIEAGIQTWLEQSVSGTSS